VAEGNQEDRRQRLPIKLIMPKQGTERRVPGGSAPPKPFRSVDALYRGRLANQVSALTNAIVPQMQRVGAAPFRVKLLSKAAAKSHRPDHLFSEESCPVIGVGRLGELFLKGTARGLEQLKDVIQNNQSDRITKELSCIESIEPITPAFRRHGMEPKDVLRNSPRGHRGFITRARLFDFGDERAQPQLVDDFEKTCRDHGIRLATAGYSPSSFTYEMECRGVQDVEAVSRIIGVRSITHMPLIRTVRQKMLLPRPLPKLPRREDTTGDFPVVVVVDSGVSSLVPDLDAWVVGRDSFVAPEYQNADHGTFVAGLICWGAELNPTIGGIDNNACGIFDLQVIPNHDPAKGDTLGLLESEFLVSLDAALQEYANKYKVWNLSLGTDRVCSLDEFSALAEELDNLQEKYRVSFVIAAGNYDTPPLLGFPRVDEEIGNGRITAPADSVLGITVGSISHVGYNKQAGPAKDHPSPFSRHGAGPNHVIKPDLVHYGGTCSTDVGHVSGIRSVHGSGTAENLGTSFAAPLVSRTLAQIYHQITPTPSPVLARALLTHHARDPRTGKRIPDGDENAFGFGLPSTVPYCLECTPYTSTLVFDDVLRAGYFLEWDHFPYPTCLRRNGKYFGEIWMTVAFVPARGGRWGTEYCETHIDAHFGVYRTEKSRETGEVKPQLRFEGLVPPEHKNPGLLYESYQVEKLRKWAPVRTYHGGLGKSGKRGERWRLKVQLLTRHGVEDQAAFRPQSFSLIITIADPNNKAPVYDEMAQIVRTRFHAENIMVRAAARIRADQMPAGAPVKKVKGG
jgi:serine protease AprX